METLKKFWLKTIPVMYRGVAFLGLVLGGLMIIRCTMGI
jgi:hypothetical protein